MRLHIAREFHRITWDAFFFLFYFSLTPSSLRWLQYDLSMIINSLMEKSNGNQRHFSAQRVGWRATHWREKKGHRECRDTGALKSLGAEGQQHSPWNIQHATRDKSWLLSILSLLLQLKSRTYRGTISRPFTPGLLCLSVCMSLGN